MRSAYTALILSIIGITAARPTIRDDKPDYKYVYTISKDKAKRCWQQWQSSATWQRLGVDDYIEQYLQLNPTVSRSTFISDFPFALGEYDMDCALWVFSSLRTENKLTIFTRDKTCLIKEDLSGMTDDEVRGSLVVAALGHLNDVMISIDQLYVADSKYYDLTVSKAFSSLSRLVC